MMPVKPTSFAAAVLFACMLSMPAPAAGQKVAVPRDGSSQPAGGGDSGGGKISSGGQTSSGGGQTSSAGGRPVRGTPRTGAVERRPSSDGGARSGGRTVVRRDPDAGDSGARGGDNDSVPPYTRPRGGNPPTGEAVERRGGAPVRGDGGTTVWVPGGYYGGYYPWGYGGIGLGGYYGGYSDPWYYGNYQPYYSGYGFEGRLRLKVKPRTAEVFVDGYFAGLVDEFDGIFQRLHIEPGPHRIEIREQGFEPLVFDVRMQPDRTITYTGDLRRQP